MINKTELLEHLQKFDHYLITESVDLIDEKRRGVMHITVYDNVDLYWYDTYFKFWDEKDKANVLYINAEIENIEWNRDTLTLHLVNCPEIINIVCSVKS